MGLACWPAFTIKINHPCIGKSAWILWEYEPAEKFTNPPLATGLFKFNKVRSYGMLNYAQADFSGRHTTRVLGGSCTEVEDWFVQWNWNVKWIYPSCNCILIFCHHIFSDYLYFCAYCFDISCSLIPKNAGSCDFKFSYVYTWMLYFIHDLEKIVDPTSQQAGDHSPYDKCPPSTWDWKTWTYLTSTEQTVWNLSALCGW